MGLGEDPAGLGGRALTLARVHRISFDRAAGAVPVRLVLAVVPKS
jgi:hypothetical protein